MKSFIRQEIALPVGLLIRPLALADLPGLLDVQRSCYGGGYVESAEVFAQRIACPTQCSLVLEVQGRVMAYLAAYDSMMGKVTQLHGEFEPAPHPDTLYLHDLAVLPELGGQGMAARLLHTLWQGAQRRGLQRAALRPGHAARARVAGLAGVAARSDDPPAGSFYSAAKRTSSPGAFSINGLNGSSTSCSHVTALHSINLCFPSSVARNRARQ